MGMPNDLVFVRHGFSEANAVHKATKNGEEHVAEPLINDRPDFRQRLAKPGVEQAKIAGAWISENLNGLASFDALYVSPFFRTRETAAHLGGESVTGWTVDDRLAERSWGIYGITPYAQRQTDFPLTAQLHKSTPFYVRFDGGESMPDVYGRFRDFQGTLHREQEGKRVLVVAHGDFINAARYGVERMLPEQWEDLDADKAYTIRNCSIMHFTRINPEDPTDIRPKIKWRRMIYPDAPSESPDGGNWVELPDRIRYSGADLLEQVSAAPNLLKDDQ